MYEFDWSSIVPSLPYLLDGLVITLKITVTAVVIGILWGTMLAVMRLSSFAPVAWFAKAYVNVFRSIPLVMDLLEVGKIVNTHGLRGEVKVVPWTDYPEVFEDIDFVYVKKKSEYERLDVKGIKYQKNNLIVRFSQITDINMAEKYKNQVIYAEREILGELPEGVYYIADLIGLDIVTEDGEKIGTVSDVFNTGSNDIYEVKREGKKNLLLPVIDDVVLNIDVDGGKITVRMMDGLEDLA